MSTDCPIFKVGLPPIISGMGKATDFKFCTGTHIHRINRNKSPLKISGKVAVCAQSGTVAKFSRHPYRAHHAVIIYAKVTFRSVFENTYFTFFSDLKKT